MNQNRPDIGAIFKIGVGMPAGDKPGYLGNESDLLQGIGMPSDRALAALDHACYGRALGAAEAGMQTEIDDVAQYVPQSRVAALLRQRLLFDDLFQDGFAAGDVAGALPLLFGERVCDLFIWQAAHQR